MRSIEEINAAFAADMVALRDQAAEDRTLRKLAPESVDRYIASNLREHLDTREKRLVALAAEVEGEPR